MQETTSERHSWAVSVITAGLAISAATILATLPFLSELALPSGSGPAMDPNFRIPALPVDSLYHPTYTKYVTLFMSALYAAGIAFALRDSLRRKTPVPVVLAASGVVLCIPEVFFDVMGSVWFPVSADDNAYTIIGRQMSWAIVAMWAGFAGPALYQCYSAFRKGISNRAMWWVFVSAALGSIPVEEMLLHMDQYYYYGNQPLIFFGKHPFWWAPCNGGGLFLAAALAYRLEHQLRGWRSLALLLLTPMSMSGIYGFIAMPSWIAVNGNYGWLVTQAAGILTVLMGFMAIALVIHFVIRGAPAPVQVPASTPVRTPVRVPLEAT